MTPSLRAGYGALLGAVITLLVHPASRPFLLGAAELSPNPAARARVQLPGPFPKTLPDPVDDESASVWVHVAAERLQARQPLTRNELQALVLIAKKREPGDSENAFWRFAAALFYYKLGDKAAAQREWLAASKCPAYDDMQSTRLGNLRRHLAGQFLSGAWQYAYVYRLRSVAFAREIEVFARDTVVPLGRESLPDLKMRYATLVNGNSMRIGSRSLAIMESGIAIVEFASHPPELKNETSIKRLLIAHFEFKEGLKKHGLTTEAMHVEKIYDLNDAWGALTRREDTDENAALQTMESSVWPTLPGAMLLVSALGIGIVGIGQGLAFLAGKGENAFRIAAFGLAVVLAGLVLTLTHSWLAVLATGLACLFVLISPRHVRRKPPEEMGPLFVFATLILAGGFTLVGAIFFLCRTLPLVANLEAFSAPMELFTNADLMAGLGLILLSMLYLISPLWAVAQRIRTSMILAEAFRSFGAIVATLALVLAVVSTPLCIFFEGQTLQTLKMLVENEPVYYLNQ